MEKAIAALAVQCRIMRSIRARVGKLDLRNYDSGFSALAEIITGQQLSSASADAIWTRVNSAIRPFDAQMLGAWPDAELAKLGLSRGKIKTLKALSSEVSAGLDLDALTNEDEDNIIERLTAIHGIGPWTADIYLLFVLRRSDAFPAGDLALQIAAQHHFKLKTRPTAAELRKLADRWRPWRGVAARLLWADYATVKAAKKNSAAAKRPVSGTKNVTAKR